VKCPWQSIIIQSPGKTFGCGAHDNTASDGLGEIDFAAPTIGVACDDQGASKK
jgi:hypothetical protein